MRLSVLPWAVRLKYELPSGLMPVGTGESNQGRMADALAHGGDEGRDKLR